MSATREKILDVVFKLVYVYGYNGTSLSMILKECDIPKGSLYHFFSSKKELVLYMISERLSPKVDEFYELKSLDGEDGIETIIRTILKVEQKEELLRFGCPINRLNQEMSTVDKDFEEAILPIYENIKTKIVNLLKDSALKRETDINSVAEFIIAGVWGALSLSPVHSTQDRYLKTTKHLIDYLRSLRK